MRIRAPPKSGSEFFNYEKYFSLILMASVDFNYRFTIVGIGAFGRESDAGSQSAACEFGKALDNGNLTIPALQRLSQCESNKPPFPYVFSWEMTHFL